MKPEVFLLTAVHNDWESLDLLLDRIDSSCAGTHRVHVLVIDDASDDPRPTNFAARAWRAIESLEFLRLTRNMGHQKAMAVGLGHLSRRELGSVLGVLLMDSDGEDPPEKVTELLGALGGAAARVAVRGKRPESWRVLYGAFKLLFRWATGEKLDFGNFMFLSREAAESIAYSPHTSEHVAASLLKTGLPRAEIRIDRGTRYAGKSQMSLAALFRHGIAALAVFREVVLVRASCLLALYGILAALVYWWGGQWAIWGALVLGILLAPALLGCVLAGFLLLVRGKTVAWVPALEYETCVSRVDTIALSRS